ncbi:MAG TPA: hypothetical protein VII13_06655 [Vicinamibacteria bacterium]|jgi:hypothetical protein
MMRQHLRLARLYLVLLAIFTAGRLAVGATGKPYEKGHHFFSIVILTALSCVFYGAFCRRWANFRVLETMGLTATLGLMGQVVIFLATAVSYLAGVNTYFTHPIALNVDHPIPFGHAMAVRASGLVGNTIMSGIVGALGWTLGALLPSEPRAGA